MPAGALEWEDINLPADFSLWLAGPQSDFLQGRFVWYVHSEACRITY